MVQSSAESNYSVAELAGALVSAVLSASWPTSPAERSELQEAFAAARSVRLALPLGTGGAGLVIVSSDLRACQHPTTFWAAPYRGSLVGTVLQAGRTAALEGAAIHPFADLEQLRASEGSTSFLCLPVLLEPPLAARSAVAVLLLAYGSSVDAPQEELRRGLLLAGRLSYHHSQELHSYAARLQDALHPSEHMQWGPGIDPQYPELSDPESSDSDGLGDSSDADASSSSGSDDDEDTYGGRRAALGSDGVGIGSSAAGAHSLHHHHRHRGDSHSPRGRHRSHSHRRVERLELLSPRTWTMSSRTLRFADERLERKFQLWRNRRMAKVDTTALLALLLYHLASCFLPSFSHACNASVGARISSGLLPALTVLVPLLLLLLNRSQRWYGRHRDQLLVCTYVLLVCHHALDMPTSLLAAPQGMWRAVVMRVEYTWCILLGIVLQVQFVGQCLMLAGAVVLKALVQPACTAWLSRGSSHPTADVPGIDACVLDGFPRALLLQVMLPCGLAYYMELSARRTFCRLRTHAAHM